MAMTSSRVPSAVAREKMMVQSHSIVSKTRAFALHPVVVKLVVSGDASSTVVVGLANSVAYASTCFDCNDLYNKI
jgi:hypothetical protein